MNYKNKSIGELLNIAYEEVLDDVAGKKKLKEYTRKDPEVTTENNQKNKGKQSE